MSRKFFRKVVLNVQKILQESAPYTAKGMVPNFGISCIQEIFLPHGMYLTILTQILLLEICLLLQCQGTESS